jgi:hypothetical protein
MGGFTLHQFVSVPKDILIEGLKRQKIISKKNLKKILNWIKMIILKLQNYVRWTR